MQGATGDSVNRDLPFVGPLTPRVPLTSTLCKILTQIWCVYSLLINKTVGCQALWGAYSTSRTRIQFRGSLAPAATTPHAWPSGPSLLPHTLPRPDKHARLPQLPATPGR